MKEIIKKAKKLSEEQMEKYGNPSKGHIEYLLNKALELAEKFKKADKDTIKLAVYLLDIRLGKCLHENKIKNHSKEGGEAARDFLKKFDLEDSFREKIINCVESHHAECSFKSIEAEICANADCYPFIHPKGFFEKLMSCGKKREGLKESLEFLNSKLDEKWNILSLDICKKELKGYYKTFKKLIADTEIL